MVSCDLIVLELLKSGLQLLVVLFSTYLTYVVIIVPAWQALEDYKTNNGIIESARGSLDKINTLATTLMKTDKDHLKEEASQINVSVATLGKTIREKLKPVYPDLADLLKKGLFDLEDLVQPNIVSGQQGEPGRVDTDKIVESVYFIDSKCEALKDCLKEWVERGVRVPTADEIMRRIARQLQALTVRAPESKNAK